MKTSKLLGGVLFLSLMGAPAFAQTVVRAVMTGAEENPPVPTNASGQGIFLVFPDRIEYSITASRFGTPVQAGHVHLGFPGVNGPIILPFFNAQTDGAFPGQLSGTFFATDFVALPDRGIVTFEDVRQALLNGRTYVNLHTTLVPGGEIRGQILPLPPE
jgi:hypothetical protein